MQIAAQCKNAMCNIVDVQFTDIAPGELSEYALPTLDVVDLDLTQPTTYAKFVNDWITAGGVPDPYVPPPPEVAPETSLLYEHENRLLALEGKPSMPIGDFIDKVEGIDNVEGGKP